MGDPTFVAGAERAMVGLGDRLQHLGAIQVRPGLTSWGILSRPCGTGPSLA